MHHPALDHRSLMMHRLIAERLRALEIEPAIESKSSSA